MRNTFSVSAIQAIRYNWNLSNFLVKLWASIQLFSDGSLHRADTPYKTLTFVVSVSLDHYMVGQVMDLSWYVI